MEEFELLAYRLLARGQRIGILGKEKRGYPIHKCWDPDDDECIKWLQAHLESRPMSIMVRPVNGEMRNQDGLGLTAYFGGWSDIGRDMVANVAFDLDNHGDESLDLPGIAKELDSIISGILWFAKQGDQMLGMHGHLNLLKSKNAYQAKLMILERIRDRTFHDRPLSELIEIYPKSAKESTETYGVGSSLRLPFGPSGYILVGKPIDTASIDAIDLGGDLGGYTKYLNEHGPCISGQGGSVHLLKACSARQRFGLDRSEARTALLAYNMTCQPPWTEEEIDHKLDDAKGASGDKPKPGNLVVSSIDDILESADRECPYLWDGILGKGSLAILVGDPKTGKSTLAYALVARMESGGTFLGRRVEPGRALILTEESELTIASKIIQFGLKGKNITFGMNYRNAKLDIRNPVGEYDLVVIDTMTAWSGGIDENTSAMGSWMVSVRAAVGEGTCLIIHHARKPRQGQSRRPLHMIRGSSSISAAADIILHCSQGPSDDRILEYEGRMDSGSFAFALRGSEYVLTEANQTSKHAPFLQLLGTTQGDGRSVAELAEMYGKSQGSVRGILASLGDLVASTQGSRGRPSLYWRRLIIT